MASQACETYGSLPSVEGRFAQFILDIKDQEL